MADLCRMFRTERSEWVLLCTSLRTHHRRGVRMGDSTFTFRVDEELKAAFLQVAADQEHTAAQLLRVLMRDAVERRREAQQHDAWFRGEVEQAVRQAEDPAVDRMPHDQVASSWRQQRADLERRAAGPSA
jgi:hypothetical protein